MPTASRSRDVCRNGRLRDLRSSCIRLAAVLGAVALLGLRGAVPSETKTGGPDHRALGTLVGEALERVTAGRRRVFLLDGLFPKDLGQDGQRPYDGK